MANPRAGRIQPLARGSGVRLPFVHRYRAFCATRCDAFLALFLLILSNRDLHHATVFSLRDDNPWLARMFVGVALVLAAVMLIPGLRAVMGFASVGLPPLIAALGLLLLCGLWLQGLRLAWGRRLA